MTRDAIVQPVFSGSLGGRPLRFFKAPRPGPHLVWHAVDDLHHCLAMPRDLRRHYRQQLQRDYRKDVETIATDQGIDIIAPHWMAQGLIQGLEEVRFAPRGTETAYAMEAGRAQKALFGDLPPAAGIEMAIAAFRNSNGLGDAS